MVARIEALRYPLDDEKRYSPMAVFRQLISQGRIKFNFGVVSVEPKEDDLRRVHDIINEIDNRRAFYNSMEDEIPAPVVESIRAAKQKAMSYDRVCGRIHGLGRLCRFCLMISAIFLPRLSVSHCPNIGMMLGLVGLKST